VTILKKKSFHFLKKSIYCLGHLRYSLTDVPPQSNSPPGSVLESHHAGALIGARNVRKLGQPTGPHVRTYGHGTTLISERRTRPPHRLSKETIKVVVFHRRCCHLSLMLHLTVPDRVKLNRVFFPR
jgi:hypothetical protein